jgi:deoxyribonuclease V
MAAMWPRTAAELEAAQRALAMLSPPPWSLPTDRPAIGACVVCWPRGESGFGAPGDRGWAAAAVLREQHAIAETDVAGQAAAGYEPGLLALREGPLLEAAVRSLAQAPDVVLVDATGRDHPRRAGLALHLGAVLDAPTVGVTHRPLLARGPSPPDVAGAATPLLLDGERVGAWLRTRAGTRPVAVHPAWRTDVDVALEVVRAASRGHRTPEPLRLARRRARRARAGG